MDDVKVSVCMVTYNQERFIAQAVENALAQETSFPFEIVIGEDCSTDGTRAIVSDLAIRHPERIRLRLADRNQGAKANFISTFGACRGQYVALLEGDDYWTCPTKLQMQVEALDARPDWAMCFHPTKVLFEDGSYEPRTLPANWDRPEASIVDLFQTNFIPTGAVLFRNRLMPELPTWFHESQLGDWPLHILNAAHGNIGFLPDAMSVYRIHAQGLWSSMDLGTQLVLTFKMLSAVDHHFTGKYAREIDENRLTTLYWLVNEINVAKGLPQEVAALRDANERLTQERDKLRADYEAQDFSEEIASLYEICARLGAEQRALKAYHEAKPVPDEIVALNQAFRRLAEENRVLKEFHDSWHTSLTYRIARETRRPFKQFWNKAQRLLRSLNDGQPPSAGPISKAA